MRPEKTSITKEIKEKLDGAPFVLLVGYKGMTVEQIRDFRGRLRSKGSRLQVVKNSMLNNAAKDLKWEGFSATVEGPTAVIYGSGDISEVSKVVKTFSEENKNVPVPCGGRLGVQALSALDIASLAMMPPREVMLGMMVGTVAAPLSQLVGVLNQKVLSLLYVLKAAGEKKSQSN